MYNNPYPKVCQGNAISRCINENELPKCLYEWRSRSNRLTNQPYYGLLVRFAPVFASPSIFTASTLRSFVVRILELPAVFSFSSFFSGTAFFVFHNLLLSLQSTSMINILLHDSHALCIIQQKSAFCQGNCVCNS